MKTPEEIKKGLAFLAATSVSERCEVAKRGITYIYLEDVAKDALAYIKQLEDDRPKWISVYAVLPTRKMKCIVSSKAGRTFTTWYDPEIYRFFPHFAKPNVTHWMPLPEPPGEV